MQKQPASGDGSGDQFFLVEVMPLKKRKKKKNPPKEMNSEFFAGLK